MTGLPSLELEVQALSITIASMMLNTRPILHLTKPPLIWLRHSKQLRQISSRSHY